MNVTLVLPKLDKIPNWLVKFNILPGKPYPPSPPLGLLWLAAFIENQGHNIKVIDNYAKKLDNDDLVKEILRDNPDIVGFHITSLTYPEMEKNIKSLKNLNKELVIVVGGPLATFYSKKIASNNNINFVIRNEGEITFSELINAIDSKGNFDRIKGLTFKKNDRIIQNIDRPFIENLDNLPFPARHLVDFSFYPRKEIFINKYPLDVICTSRGCPFNCSFCSSSRHIFRGTYRCRSAKNVVDEIEFLINNYNTKALNFREDLFTADKKHVIDICDELIKRKIDIIWFCESRVDTVNKELLKKMKLAGCEAIWFGCESGSQKILDYLNKDITTSQIERTFKCCKEEGITTGAAFIVGIPGETKEDVFKTLELAKKIKADHIWPRIFIGTPKSKIYDEIIKKKYYRPGYEWQGYVAVETKEFSVEDTAKYQKMLDKEFTKIMLKRRICDLVSGKKNFLNSLKDLQNWIKLILLWK